MDMDPDPVTDPDADPDPSIDLQDVNKKLIKKKKFFCRLLFEGTYSYIIFQRLKAKKKSQNSKNQGFSSYFCLMIEGSGSGSIPLTNGSRSGSGSRWSKNMWIRIQIRIRNTAKT